MAEKMQWKNNVFALRHREVLAGVARETLVCPQLFETRDAAFGDFLRVAEGVGRAGIPSLSSEAIGAEMKHVAPNAGAASKFSDLLIHPDSTGRPRGL